MSRFRKVSNPSADRPMVPDYNPCGHTNEEPPSSRRVWQGPRRALEAAPATSAPIPQSSCDCDEEFSLTQRSVLNGTDAGKRRQRKRRLGHGSVGRHEVKGSRRMGLQSARSMHFRNLTQFTRNGHTGLVAFWYLLQHKLYALLPPTSESTDRCACPGHNGGLPGIQHEIKHADSTPRRSDCRTGERLVRQCADWHQPIAVRHREQHRRKQSHHYAGGSDWNGI